MLKKERFNVMFNPRVIAAIDAYANFIDSSRSEILNEIAYNYVMENNLFSFVSEEQIDGQLEVV